MSSLPCTYKGKKVLQLKKGHLLQQIWAPRYTLWLIDEAGKFMPQQSFENKITALVDTYREIGHFKFWCIYCEQRQDNIQIDVRSMTQLTQCMQGQKNYCKPHLLERYYNRLQNKALHPKNENNVALALKLERIKNYIDSIGFRVWYSTIWQSNGKELTSTKLTLYWTQNLDFDYDNECMFVAYKAEPDTVKENVAWENTLLTREQADEFFAPYKKPDKNESLTAEERIKKLIPALNFDVELPKDINVGLLLTEINKSDLVKRWKNLSVILKHYDEITSGKYRNKSEEEIAEICKQKNREKAKSEELAKSIEPSDEDDGEVHCFD